MIHFQFHRFLKWELFAFWTFSGQRQVVDGVDIFAGQEHIRIPEEVESWRIFDTWTKI
jgi:hypothetical protein